MWSSLNFTSTISIMKAYWGSGDIAARIFDLGTRWRWVVSFTPRPLYLQGKSPWYPLDRSLGGFQSVWTRWLRENSEPLPGIRTPDQPTPSPVLYHWAIPAPYTSFNTVKLHIGEEQMHFNYPSTRFSSAVSRNAFGKCVCPLLQLCFKCVWKGLHSVPEQVKYKKNMTMVYSGINEFACSPKSRPRLHYL
jgi:hypothetical protein